MYKTLIRPIISYSFSSWFTISPTVAKELEKFERTILRFCSGKFRKPNKKWFSNHTLYNLTKVSPLMIYMVTLLKKKLQSVVHHLNPLIKDLWDVNVNDSTNAHYYLSPFNLMHNGSQFLTEPELNEVLTLPFYEKASLNALRG